MEKFLEELEKNEELKAKVEELDKRPDAVPADFIALAKEYGFTLTEEDFHAGKKTEGELSDDEMEAVAGGDACGCFSYGDGLAGYGGAQRCQCPLGGTGWTSGEGVRCLCCWVGGGTET